MHAHPDVAENVESLVRGEYARQHLPRMQHRIAYISSAILEKSPAQVLTFKKMVQTSIPGNLKLGPNTHGSPTRLCNDDTLDDAFHISLYSHIHSLQLRFARAQKATRTHTWKSIAHWFRELYEIQVGPNQSIRMNETLAYHLEEAGSSVVVGTG